MSAIAVRDQLGELRQILDAKQKQIAASLPPGVMTRARFEQSILTLCGHNPRLLSCNRTSLVGAVLRSAHLGLDPDPALGQSWFVPFKGVVQFIPGYRGLLQLCWRTGQLSKVGAEVVRADDSFVYSFGAIDELKHVPLSSIDAEITHAYALARVSGMPDISYVVLRHDEIESIRRSAPSAKAEKSPWISHYAEMAKKTALRRLCKLLPASGERALPLQKAMDLDERGELGLKQNNAEELLDAEETEQTEEKADPGTDQD